MFFIGLHVHVYRENIKQSSCLKQQGLETNFSWYVSSPSGPLPSLFKYGPGSHPGGHMF